MANIGADLSILDAARAVPKNRASAIAAGQGTKGLKEDTILPIVTAVESMLDGVRFELAGPTALAIDHPLSTIKVFARTAAASYVFAGNEAHKLFNKGSAIRFAADIDLPLDGSDATAALNAGMASGGATLLIDVPVVRVDGRVQIQDGCALAFGAGTRVQLGALGGFEAAGYWATAWGEEDALGVTADVAAGGTTAVLDTSPQGGGGLSALLSAGERIVLRDGAGSRHEAKVTTVTDPGTIVWTPACPFALPALTSSVDRQQVLHLDAGTTAGSAVLTVRAADMPRISQYRYLAVTDDATAGAAAAGHRLEIAQVVGINLDGTNTVRLDRPLRRAFSSGSDSRAHVLAPVVGARLSGVNVEFREAPAASRVDTFVQDLCVDTVFEGCRVPNEDLFGSRGRFFTTRRSLRTGYAGCWGLRPKFTASGEGFGWHCAQSTECYAERMVFEGCRYGVAYEGSTDCWAELTLSKSAVVRHFAWLGAGEQNCWVRGAWTERGPGTFLFGDTANTAGCTDCFGRDVVSMAPTGAHVEFLAGATRCGLEDFTFIGGLNAVSAKDILANSALQAVDNYIKYGRVFGTTGWAVEIDGGINNSASRAVVRQRTSEVEFAGCALHFYARRCSGPVFEKTEVRSPVIPPADDHCLRGQDCAGIMVRRSDWIGIRKALHLTNAVDGRVYSNRWVDFNGGTDEYVDGGGNTGLVGVDNLAVGFTKTGAIP